MPSPEKLRFRARAHYLVTDYDAMTKGMRRFIGRTLNRDVGPEFVDMTTRDRPTRRHAVFEPMVEHEEVVHDPLHAPAYAQEVVAGCLWPDDEETAAYCAMVTGKPIKFDPTFGGELEEEKKARAAREAAMKPAAPSAAPNAPSTNTPAPAAGGKGQG